MPLQIRRGPTADRNAITPVEGELIWDTQLEQLFIGNGSTAGGIAAANFTAEEAQDASADLFTSHSDHEGVSFSYDDVLNKVVATVSQDLSNYQGVIGADGFKGSVFADDSQILVDGVLGSFNLNGTIRSHIVPAADSVYDLGTSGNKFRDLYLSGSSLFLGDATITSTGTAVNLPAGSTIGGSTIGAGTGIVNGTNFNINIVGDDSTLVVDSATATFNGTLNGTVNGDVNGSVFADDSTSIIDAINKSISIQEINIGNTPFSADGLRAIIGNTENPAEIVFNAGAAPALTVTGVTEAVGGISPNMSFAAYRGTVDAQQILQNGDVLGLLLFGGFNGVAQSPGGFINAVIDDPSFGNGDAVTGKLQLGAFPGASTGNFVTIDGNGILSAPQIEGSFVGDITGSLFADTSTVVFDGTDSRLFVENINVVGETGNSPADTGSVDSWLEVVVNGATKYIPLYD